MIVAVALMGVVKMPINEVIDVITVRDGLMTAVGAVGVVALMA